MSASLIPAASALDDTLRALERGLSQARGPWNDAARATFDRLHIAPITADAQRAVTEVRQLASDLTAAMRLLEDSA
ncbi:MAG TPA: hypothetical protein VMU95_32575 [Trebonia sp.]|nr:hypothetical protein [Trebonia sp.]